MTLSLSSPLWHHASYDLNNLADEMRVDQTCGTLLQTFRDDLLARGSSPLEAGEMARGADYFLRDFIIDDRRRNIFEVGPREVRQFAGNWYIVRNLEPNLKELSSLLRGVAAFYAFAARNGAVTETRAAEIGSACNEIDYFAARIESFWKISGDGYGEWERLCSLKG